MKYIKSKKGYYYKIYNNGKKKRISKDEYLKMKINGGASAISKCCGSTTQYNPVIEHAREPIFSKLNRNLNPLNSNLCIPNQIKKWDSLLPSEIFDYFVKFEFLYKSIKAYMTELKIEYLFKDIYEPNFNSHNLNIVINEIIKEFQEANQDKLLHSNHFIRIETVITKLKYIFNILFPLKSNNNITQQTKNYVEKIIKKEHTTINATNTGGQLAERGLNTKRGRQITLQFTNNMLKHSPYEIDCCLNIINDRF